MSNVDGFSLTHLLCHRGRSRIHFRRHRPVKLPRDRDRLLTAGCTESTWRGLCTDFQPALVHLRCTRRDQDLLAARNPAQVPLACRVSGGRLVLCDKDGVRGCRRAPGQTLEREPPPGCGLAGRQQPRWRRPCLPLLGQFADGRGCFQLAADFFGPSSNSALQELDRFPLSMPFARPAICRTQDHLGHSDPQAGRTNVRVNFRYNPALR